MKDSILISERARVSMRWWRSPTELLRYDLEKQADILDI